MNIASSVFSPGEKRMKVLILPSNIKKKKSQSPSSPVKTHRTYPNLLNITT